VTDKTNKHEGATRQPVFEVLQALIEAGHELIPLNGKTPAAKGWRAAKPLEPEKAVERLELAKGNVGVRLRPTDLVIDVDPRNFDDGDDPVHRLESDLDIRLADWMTTVTGSGGTHHYMRVESGQSFLNALAAYPGIEFKAHGRQVVAPGSIHPETGQPYVLQMPDPLDERAEAPATLLDLIRRPVGALAAEPGILTPEKLAELLALLDPTEFASNDLWFPVMAASHHATGGDGLEEFLAWSAGDAGYVGHEARIAPRWNSLHADSSGRRFTAGTLAVELRGRGHEAEAARLSATIDFPEDAEGQHENLPERVDTVKAKRQANAAKARQAKAEKGALRKLRQAADAESYARFMNATFVFNLLDGKWFNVETGEKFAASNMEIVHGPGWARSGGRGALVQAISRGKSGIDIPDVYMAAAFPGKPRIVKAELGSGHAADMLNTWYDTTLEPIEGDHGWFLEEVGRWFPGDTYQQEILLDELALRVLEPGRKIRHALVIESVQGVGKGQLKGGFETLFGWGNCGVFGVTQMKDKFDRWKVGAANLFGEEIGFNKWSDAKDAYEAMKTAITDDYIAIRPMNGESELKVPNGTNYVINRNPDMKFYIPAGGDDDDERRICYLRPEPEPIDEKGPVFQRLKRHYSSKHDMAAVAWWLVNTWSPGRRVYEEQGIELAGVGHASYDSDPPMTDAKRTIIREGLDADHIAPVNFVGLARVVDELGSLFTAADAVALVKAKGLDQFDASDGKLADAVSKWLKAQGFKRTRNTSGQGVTVYSPATDEWSAKKAAEREKAYLSGKTGA
jgi:Bifunctional DNA primase/polymerase, N-terminal/Family of unknown function (DUF5906)/Primase C terminal 2 (PriCT-2)